MQRRTFLKTLLVSAGALSGLAACADDSNNTAADTGIADGSGDGSGSGAETTPTPLTVVAAPALFPQSVASGDPRPGSVILWTRIVEGDASSDTALELEVATDEAFANIVPLEGTTSKQLTALAQHDHCVKVRVTELSPASSYFYRFSVVREGERRVSKTGRTRTAPAVDADTAVRFAFVSCQDFAGKYYNTYARLNREELDFVIHLGDYIYETSADPAFQASSPDRSITFDDRGGSILFNAGTEGEFGAASSLDNYRQLYRTYRSDADLQQAHERFPFLVIWDDHEFSDDCHGATATYYDGRQDERSVERRMRANQAWWEYQPVDYEDRPDFVYDSAAAWPEDLRIYRRLRFGRHMELSLTDLRTYRSDHLIAEDGYPGQVLVTADQLAAAGAAPDFASPYADIATFAGGRFLPFLQSLATDGGYPVDRVTGLISIDYLQGRITANAGRVDLPIPPNADELAGLPRGLAIHHTGKTGLFSQIGSRYLARKEPYLLISDLLYRAAPEAEQALGSTQEQWLVDGLSGSDASWKVWANSFTLQQRVVDVTSFRLPDDFKQKFLLSVEDWDGMPSRRAALVERLGSVSNLVAITGDIHAFFAGTLPKADGSAALVEYVGSSLSSGTYKTLLVKTASADETLRDAGAAALALLVEELLVSPETKPNPHLALADIDRNGFSIATVSAASFDVDFYAIAERAASARLTDAELDAAFEVTRMQTRTGDASVWRDFEGTWKRWNPATFAWEA